MKAQKISIIMRLLTQNSGVHKFYIHKGNDVEPELYRELPCQANNVNIVMRSKKSIDFFIDEFLKSL